MKSCSLPDGCSQHAGFSGLSALTSSRAFACSDGHLLSAVTGSDVTTYTVDTGGRRTGETGPSGSAGMAWTGDDYLASYVATDSANVRVVDASYAYDGNGQRLSASVTATSAFSPDTAVATAYTYAWEGTDLAVFTAASSEGSASVSYLFDESDRPYAAAVSFTGLGGSEETTSAAIRLLTNDHGDILALADASGEVFARYTYGPFGEAEGINTRATALLSADEAALIATIQPLRYAGYCFDTWSGDYYLQARYYDPETRQFLSKDPDKADGEESAYQYCSGDPVDAVDPTGEFAWVAVGAVAGALIGGGIAYYKAKKAGKTGWALAGSVALGALDGGMTGAQLATGVGALAVAAKSGGMFAAKSLGKSALKKLASRFRANPGCGKKALQFWKTGCFVAGTMVRTDHGDVAIESIEPGDLVLSRDDQTGEAAYKEVVRVFRYETYELVHVGIGSDTVTATPNHPFWVDGEGWVEAGDLEAGDEIVLASGLLDTIVSVEREILSSPVDVYNFEVADFHTYFVSSAGVWVHNQCAGMAFDKNQQALISLAKEAKKRGPVAVDDARTLLRWAREYKLRPALNHMAGHLPRVPGQKGVAGHIRIGPINHIWTR